MPSSRGSSQPRDWAQFFCIAAGFFTLSPQGSPRTMEWVAYLFSRGSSWSRNWTGVSCIAGGFITSWATWEAPRMATGSEIEGRGFKSKLLKLWIQTFPTTLHWNSFITTVVFFLCCCCCWFSFFPGPKTLINKASAVCKIIRNFLPGYVFLGWNTAFFMLLKFVFFNSKLCVLFVQIILADSDGQTSFFQES